MISKLGSALLAGAWLLSSGGVRAEGDGKKPGAQVVAEELAKLEKIYQEELRAASTPVVNRQIQRLQALQKSAQDHGTSTAP